MPISRVKEHMRLRQYIVNLAMRAETDAPIPTERELAVMFGVARGTVRRTLENMVVDRFLTKIPRRGYFPNSTVNCEEIRDKKLVGLLLFGGGLAFYETEAIKVLRAFLAQADRMRLNVEMVFVSNVDHISEEIKQSRLDGLFWWGVMDRYIPALERIYDSGLPVVSVCQWNTQPRRGDYIWLDNVYEARLRIDYLLSHGAERIAYISSFDQTRLREGCKDVFQKFGARLYPEWFINDSEFDEKFPAMLENIDAVACRFHHAATIRRMASERGMSVPDDLQLVLDFCNTDSNPTMSRKPYSQIVSLACSKLVDLMEGKKGNNLRKTDFEWSIVEGDTTKANGSGT